MRSFILLLTLSLSGCVIHYEKANQRRVEPKPGRDSCVVTQECPKRCFFVDNGPYLHGRYECR